MRASSASSGWPAERRLSSSTAPRTTPPGRSGSPDISIGPTASACCTSRAAFPSGTGTTDAGRGGHQLPPSDPARPLSRESGELGHEAGGVDRAETAGEVVSRRGCVARNGVGLALLHEALRVVAGLDVDDARLVPGGDPVQRRIDEAEAMRPAVPGVLVGQ